MTTPKTITISTGTFIKAAGIVLGLWLLWFLRDIVAILLISVLLAALIAPFADWFAKRSIPRGLAVLIVYVILVAISTTVILALVPVLAQQSRALFENLSIYYTQISELLVSLQAAQGDSVIADNVTAGIQSIQQDLAHSASNIFSTVRGVIGFFTGLVIVLVLTFYMVVEEQSMSKYFRRFAPVEYQPFVANLLGKMQKKIGAWLRGQIILGLIVGVVTYIGLTIIGVEYALLLAVIAGLFEIIPYVGPILSVIPAAIIGFAQSPIIGLFVLFLYLLVQQLENHILVPKVMQKVTGLNPVISLVALLVGFKIGGVVGAIFAIPLATIVVVTAEEVFATDLE